MIESSIMNYSIILIIRFIIELFSFRKGKRKKYLELICGVMLIKVMLIY
jgi:hypothetical protein